jgi:dsRNA-specific ribonuclease
LLNENLLPLSRSWVEDGQHNQEEMGATVDVAAELNPWKQLAKSWSQHDLYQTRIVVKCEGDTMVEDLRMVLTIPTAIPTVFPIRLWWDEETSFHLHFDASSEVSFKGSAIVANLRSITHLLTRSSRSDYTNDDRTDFVALFSPELEENQLPGWFEANRGRDSALDQYAAKVKPRGLVRSSTLHGIPHQFHSWCNSIVESEDHVDVQCFPLTRRRNFVNSAKLPHKIQPSSHLDNTPSSLRKFPVQNSTIDQLPFTYVRFSLFMQTILRHVKSVISAETLRSTILKDVLIKDIQHVITAISAPSAGLVTDYQRYEFFGDAVLKFVVSHELFCANENWHEGFLTKRKSWLVSNQHLAKAALKQGLDVFIMTEGFKSKKWTPPLISELLEDPDQPRAISTKILADVVEALIGAAYLDGGFDLARRCVHVFLPEIPIEVSWAKRSLPITISTERIANAEVIIGYEFDSKILLLESLTHPSCDYDTKVESYQRLEFLGDAVLDMLVVRLLASAQSTASISPEKMTLIKAALVNTHFLGFLCLDYSVQSSVVDHMEETAFGCFEGKLGLRKVSLWELMRHTNKDIKNSQNACRVRYADQRESVHHTLVAGTTFPWVPLSRLHLDKFYSDMIESIIGAIFVDSRGDLAACEDFLGRIGFVSYLKRVLAEGVDVQHPKSILGQLAGPETVSYQEKVVLEKSEDTIEKRYMCTVTVGEVELAVAKDCLGREEAVWTAAVLAAEILKKRTE